MNLSQKVCPRDILASSVIIQVVGFKDSADKPAETVSTSNKPPTSMPVPTAPRRAAPPRRKKETPKSSDEQHMEEEAVAPEAKIPLPESTSSLLVDAEGEKTDVPPDADLKPVSITEPSPPVEEESPESATDPSLVTERSTSPTLVKSGDHEDVTEDARTPSPKEDQPMTSEKLAELVEEGQKEIEKLSGIDQPEQDLEEPLAEVLEDGEPSRLDRAVGGEDEHETLTTEVETAEDKPEEQPGEDEEDEATRRARITARLANSGGFNPFAGGRPVRKPSGGSLPERRTSLETPDPSGFTVHEEQEPSAQPLARDADPLDGEPGFPTTEAKEEDKPLDALKRAEGDS